MSALQSSGLAGGFLASAARFPGRPALEVDGVPVTYDELRERATAVASALFAHAPAEPRLTAVLGHRTVGAFAGVLGVALRGHGYVPLGPRFPATRNREILARSGCRALVVDSESLDTGRELLAGVEQPFVVVFADGTPPAAERGRWAPHELVGPSAADEPLPEPAPDDPAYLLFTSGSTGRPKGVLVRQANVRAFLDAVAARYAFDETDRFSQSFDLTFDLAAFDLFASWERGACVCCPRAEELLKPAAYIRASELTVWFSVPSVAMLLRRFRSLSPGAFPTLRASLFCGEALPSALAREWAAAAPNGPVDNLYGPTEATIACTAHRWNSSDAETDGGLVPIGLPLGETEVAVVDESLREVAPGAEGELVLSGPQVVGGYFDDDEATAKAFVSLPGHGPAYRTGDRVVAAPDGSLQFIGRLDTQIKVLGHRVELEEIEAAVHAATGAEAIAVGWPRTEVGAAGIVALVAGAVDPVALRAHLADRLPSYMVPREIRRVGELPLNVNGKRDRRAAEALLGEA